MTIDKLQQEFHNRLGITDRAAIPAVMLATVTNRLTTEPIWLMLIGPPGCVEDVGGLVERLTQVRTLKAAAVVERASELPND